MQLQLARMHATPPNERNNISIEVLIYAQSNMEKEYQKPNMKMWEFAKRKREIMCKCRCLARDYWFLETCIMVVSGLLQWRIVW